MSLDATDVSVGFDGERVLREVSVTARPGEVLTVVGPSGTGKTTLLRLLGLFRRPDHGTVSWDGEDLWSTGEDRRLDVRRRLSTVFQEPSLFNAPVEENVSYGLRVRRPWHERLRRRAARLVGSGDVDDSVHDALDLVGLLDKVDQNALSLSGGEAQRVAFARALAVDPSVLLLDEPTSNLDPQNTAILERAVLAARERGVGVVVATHDMNQAERLSDRVAFLLEGEVVEVGPPERIFESPRDERTRRFVNGDLLYDHEGRVVDDPDAEESRAPVSDAEESPVRVPDTD